MSISSFGTGRARDRRERNLTLPTRGGVIRRSSVRPTYWRWLGLMAGAGGGVRRRADGQVRASVSCSQGSIYYAVHQEE
jgi:hypothetical protein